MSFAEDQKVIKGMLRFYRALENLDALMESAKEAQSTLSFLTSTKSQLEGAIEGLKTNKADLEKLTNNLSERYKDLTAQQDIELAQYKQEKLRAIDSEVEAAKSSAAETKVGLMADLAKIQKDIAAKNKIQKDLDDKILQLHGTLGELEAEYAAFKAKLA